MLVFTNSKPLEKIFSFFLPAGICDLCCTGGHARIILLFKLNKAGVACKRLKFPSDRAECCISSSAAQTKLGVLTLICQYLCIRYTL